VFKKALVLLFLAACIGIPLSQWQFPKGDSPIAPMTFRMSTDVEEIFAEGEQAAADTKILQDVPAFYWAYGCSPTSAGMMFGYYDRTGYPNFYTGPVNGGVCPLTNPASYWARNHQYGDMPMIASEKGLDGRLVNGHVDDYWVAYGDKGNDPIDGNTPHPDDSVSDFMGTSQDRYLLTDGGSVFWNFTNGDPLYDGVGGGIADIRDGSHGMKLWAEYCGYTVITNYTQRISGLVAPPYPTIPADKGYTLDQYRAEIDAGFPVIIHTSGHTMIGVGYGPGSLIYIHDTWDYSTHSMTWGGSYGGMTQFAVTVFHLAPIEGKMQITVKLEV
jgi:hypothetical protein